MTTKTYTQYIIQHVPGAACKTLINHIIVINYSGNSYNQDLYIYEIAASIAYPSDQLIKEVNKGRRAPFPKNQQRNPQSFDRYTHPQIPHLNNEYHEYQGADMTYLASI